MTEGLREMCSEGRKAPLVLMVSVTLTTDVVKLVNEKMGTFREDPIV